MKCLFVFWIINSCSINVSYLEHACVIQKEKSVFHMFITKITVLVVSGKLAILRIRFVPQTNLGRNIVIKSQEIKKREGLTWRPRPSVRPFIRVT